MQPTVLFESLRLFTRRTSRLCIPTVCYRRHVSIAPMPLNPSSNARYDLVRQRVLSRGACPHPLRRYEKWSKGCEKVSQRDAIIQTFKVKATTIHLFGGGGSSVPCLLFLPPFLPSSLFPGLQVAPQIQLRDFGSALYAASGENDTCSHQTANVVLLLHKRN